MFWEQGKLDVLFEYPIQSENSYFSIHAAFDRLAQHEITTLQFLPPGGVTRAYELEGDAGLVRLDPNWYHAAGRFVVMGFHHILEGIDHLLFLFCLVIPFRRIRPLIPIVTAFTVAHSITLIASAYGYAPGCAVVSAPDRNADRGLDRLYGAGEYRGRTSGPALDHHLLLRPGAWLRLFLRPARHVAVRRQPCPDFAALLQCRRGARAVVRAGAVRARAESAVPLCRGPAPGHHHPVGAGRASGLALDGRPLRRPQPIPLAPRSRPTES